MDSKPYIITAPCHFGLEAVLKREAADLGLNLLGAEDGKVSFSADALDICRANIGLRTAERVLLSAGSFDAVTFDELFEGTKALPWEELLTKDARFWVKKATSVKSTLFSTSDIQRIVKKAIVERLRSAFGVQTLPETGAEYPIRVTLYKNRVSIGLDTSGDSLHKRGYRKFVSAAPITETLAAALIMLTPWRADRILVDPFCGCGTFPIEAAMMAAGIAPGLDREFAAEAWKNIIPKKCWYEAAEEARSKARSDIKTDIQGYDIDGQILKAARQNAALAGVDHLIHFQQRPVKDLSHPKKYGFIITNPPYGERISEREALPGIYSDFGTAFSKLDAWSAYVITSCADTEKYMGRKADKNRKIYNGMLKTYFYQFTGAKPPARKGRGTER